MSVQNIIKVMEELVMEHRSLIEIVEKKTATIKLNDMDALSNLLMKERKLVQSITRIEAKRQKAVDNFFHSVGVSNVDQSVSELLEWIDDTALKAQMEQHITALVEEIVKLKQVEQLNKELLEQSMAFVQVSLDMLNPTIHNMNYNNKHTEKPLHHTSVFDSKA